jgi:hypothetical protein
MQRYSGVAGQFRLENDDGCWDMPPVKPYVAVPCGVETPTLTVLPVSGGSWT